MQGQVTQDRQVITDVRTPDAVVFVQSQDAGAQATATDMLLAARAQREELMEQLDVLEDRRGDLERQLRQGNISQTGRAGIEMRLAEVDKQIAAKDIEIARANANVARAAAVPGAVIPEPPEPPYIPSGPPEEIVILGMLLTAALILPITLAYTRRIWRRSAAAVSALPSNIVERFTRLEHAVDSIAVEVERIGEGQRFMTRVFAEHGVPRDAIPASLTDELDLPPDTSSRGRR